MAVFVIVASHDKLLEKMDFYTSLPVFDFAPPELHGGTTNKKNANVMTSPGVIGRSWRCHLTHEQSRSMRICSRGERIGDIDLKGGALYFGKLARLVCQQTSENLSKPTRFFKKILKENTQKKELLCFVQKSSTFVYVRTP